MFVLNENKAVLLLKRRNKKDFRESNNSGYNLPSNQKDIFYPKIQLSFLFLPF